MPSEKRTMEFLYTFENASLTRCMLLYLRRKVRSHLDYVTVMFLNDRWVVHLKLDRSMDGQHREDCRAVLSEYGSPYTLPTHTLHQCISPALQDLEAGCMPTLVMNRHQVVIVSHGAPQPEEIQCFQTQFVAGLGYCPPSLV